MIITNYSDRQTPQFRVLTDSQCQELYLATLECLNRIGIEIPNPEAQELLIKAGARLEGHRVFIPAHIIQQALVTAPRTFTIWGRDNQNEMRVAPDRVNFGPGPTCTYFMDPDSGERRLAQRGDAGLTAKVCDALPNIDYIMGLSLFSDVTAVLSPVYEFAESIANTTKPVLAWANKPQVVADIYQIAAAVAGSEAALQARPLFGFFSTYPSPLRHSHEDLSNMLWAAEHGIPVIILGGPNVGSDAPVTGASGIVIHLAAALSAVAVLQLKRPGAPVVIGGVISAMDLRTARPAYGSPEMSLYSAGAADVARYLGLPFMGTAGASESKVMDAQAAAEISIQILISALSGAALVHDVGFLDCADIGSLPLLVMSDEIIGMSKRVLRGIPVNAGTIMLDLIEKVGPGGTFLMEPQSASLCRSEIWIPTLLDRKFYPNWVKDGSKTMETRVQEKLQRILLNHTPAPLPEGVQTQIDLILAQAEQRENPSA